MKFWIQVDGNKIIRDCIEFKYDGYIEADLPTPLPIGLFAGYYRWQNGSIVLDQTLKDEVDKQNRPYGYDELQQENTELKLAIAELAESNESDKVDMQLALAELAEIVEGGDQIG